MCTRLAVLLTFALCVQADLQHSENRPRRHVTLKPLSSCCAIPEIGEAKSLTECTNLKAEGPCNDVKCVFEKSNWLSGGGQTLNSDAYKAHLRAWGRQHQGWSDAAEKAIADCAEKDVTQYLDVPCKAYDVFTCTYMAMIKKCPKEAWTCREAAATTRISQEKNN